MEVITKHFIDGCESIPKIIYTETPPGKIQNFATHNHLICEILYLIEGDLIYTIEGRSYKPRRHDMIFVRPGQNHYITFSDQKTPYHRFNILVSPKLFPRELYDSLPDDADVISFEDNETVKNIFDQFEFYCNALSGEARESLFSALVCELFCQFAISAREPENRRPSSSNRTLDAALKSIEEQLCESISVQSICRELFITKSHLHHLFIENMKISPKKYINQKRLLLARRKIRRGGAPTEIYRECGFSDYTTFYRNYKSYFGYEPSLEGEVTAAVTMPPMDI